MTVHRLQVTPNTGHHAFWIPLDLESISDPERAIYRWLSTEGVTVGWRVYSQNSADLYRVNSPELPKNTNGDVEFEKFTKPHIRYRLANQASSGSIPKLGVYIVVESNLGDETRGNTLGENSPVAETLYEGQPPTLYAFPSDTEIPENRTESLFQLTYDGNPVLQFELYWAVTMATNPIPVDLVIDFGNSRTTAVLLEQVPGASDGNSTAALRHMVRPLMFFTRDAALHSDEMVYPRGASIIDSWFVLTQPRFADFELPCIDESSLLTEYNLEARPAKYNIFGKMVEPERRVITSVVRRIPQTFVEMAPLSFGPGGEAALLATKPQGGGTQMLSSPKRYAWANDPSVQEGTPYWAMLRNSWDPEVAASQNAKLSCQVLRFFPHDGENWDLSQPPYLWEPTRRPSCCPVSPNYPKADSLTWMGLGVLEAAYRWINCREYSKENLPYVKRYIRSVKLTYPSGWTEEELKAYQTKWNKAANIFHLGHQMDGTDVPEVAFPLDEAISSQLPFIFSEIEAMHGIGENYLELVGKVRGKIQTAGLRALNIDIGGGTTDFAVVEYSDQQSGAGVSLEARILFKDSTNIAGDEVVKAIIERVVLPAYGKQMAEGSPSHQEAFSEFFREPFKNSTIREEWKRATLGFFVPLAVRCIKFLSSNENSLDLFALRDGDEATYGVQDIAAKAEAFFRDQGLSDVTVEKETFKISTHPTQVFVTDITKGEIADIIREVLFPVIRRLAKFVSAFDVDIVITSGKPSEAPVVKEMVAEALPISEDRIISARNYHSGDWYPFAANGRITDAKTVTVVGLALYEAISRGYVPGWTMRQITSESILRKNHWLLLPLNASQDPTIFLKPDQDEATVEVLVNARIARKLLPTTDAPEPTYVLRWRGKDVPQPGHLKATFRRVPRVTDEGSEHLELVDAIDVAEQRPVSLQNLRLEICTIQQEDYWLDSPRFEVQWPQD